MIRTQISLDEQEYRVLRKEAKALGIPVAELVRRAIRQMLTVSKAAPWMLYAGMVKTGNPRSSRSIDEIVYGHKG